MNFRHIDFLSLPQECIDVEYTAVILCVRVFTVAIAVVELTFSSVTGLCVHFDKIPYITIIHDGPFCRGFPKNDVKFATIHEHHDVTVMSSALHSRSYSSLNSNTSLTSASNADK